MVGVAVGVEVAVAGTRVARCSSYCGSDDFDRAIDFQDIGNPIADRITQHNGVWAVGNLDGVGPWCRIFSDGD